MVKVRIDRFVKVMAASAISFFGVESSSVVGGTPFPARGVSFRVRWMNARRNEFPSPRNVTALTPTTPLRFRAVGIE